MPAVPLTVRSADTKGCVEHKNSNSSKLRASETTFAPSIQTKQMSRLSMRSSLAGNYHPQPSPLGGPPDENSPHNLCCYRAPVPGRLASFSKTLLLDSPTFEEMPLQVASDSGHCGPRQNQFVENLAPSPSTGPRGDIGPLSQVFQRKGGNSHSMDRENWVASRRSRNNSQFATRGGSSPRISLSSETETTLGQFSISAHFGAIWHWANSSGRYLSHKCVRAPRLLRKPDEPPHRDGTQQTLGVRTRVWRGLRRDS